jgi:hypothetical protein
MPDEWEGQSEPQPIDGIDHLVTNSNWIKMGQPFRLVGPGRLAVNPQ